MAVNVPTGGFGLKLQIVDAFSQNLRKYGAAVGAAQVKTKGFGAMVTKHAGTIRKMGLATTIAGGAITAAFALAIKTSAGFEQSMANVGAVAGASGEELKELSTFARKMGADTVFAASEAADAMYFLASAGYGVEKMMKALPGVLNLAAATGSDLAEVTASVVSTLNQFELGAQDATRVANVFAAVIGKSQATMDRLGISMSYVGNMADTIGLSLEQTSAILGKVYDMGIEASMAGTQLRMAFTRLTKPTKEVHSALKEMGLTYKDIDPTQKDFIKTLGLLGDKAMTLEQSLAIFGTRAGATLLKLSKRAEDIDKLTTAITGTDKAAEMADKMINTWQGTLKLLKSAIEEVQLTIGEHLLPIITPMVKKFKDVVRQIGEWMKAHPKLTAALVKFGAVLGPVLIVLGALMMILPSLVAGLPILAGAFAVLMGPVGLVLLAIAGLTAAFVYFYKTSMGFRNFVERDILTPLKRIGEGFKVVISGLVFMIKNWSETWDAARQILDATFEQIEKTIWGFFTDWSVFKAALGLFAQFGKSLVAAWINTWEMIGTVLARVLSIVWAPLIKSLQWVADSILYYFDLGMEKARNAIIEGVNWITLQVFTPMVNFFIDVVNKMTEGAGAFINFFISGMNLVTKAIKPVIDAMGWFAEHILRQELPEGIREFGEIAEVEFGKIEKLGKDALAIKIPESTLKEPAKFATRMGEAWQTIKDQYSKIPGDLQDYVNDLMAEWEDVTKAAGEFGKAVDWSDYEKKIGEVVKKLKAAGVNTDELEKSMGGFGDHLKGIGPTLDDINKRIKTGGSTITDWMQAKVEATNRELERGKLIIAALSQAVKTHGSTITDWMAKKYEDANAKLEIANRIIGGLFNSTRKLGTSITDWYIKKAEEANAELEKGQRIIDDLSQNMKNYGTSITDWYAKKAEEANEELRKAEKIIEGLSQNIVNYGSSITDWYQEGAEKANREMERGKEIIAALSQSTKNLGSSITDWYQDKANKANEEMERAEGIIENLSQSVKILGTTITDWYQSATQKANDELEKANAIIKGLSQNVMNYGTTITDWYQDKVQKANNELEKGQKIVENLSQSVKNYGSSITDWYQEKVERANDEMEKAEKIIKNLSQAVKKHGTTITDWYQKKAEKANEELEKAEKIIKGLSQNMKNLGSTITDWYEKKARDANDELERGKEIIKILIGSIKNYGTTITNWVEYPQRKANRELELAGLYLEGINLKAKQLPISTITDWSEGWAGLNLELQRARGYLTGVGLATTELGERQRILLKIQSELTGALILENKKKLDSWRRFFSEVYGMSVLSNTDILEIFRKMTEEGLMPLLTTLYEDWEDKTGAAARAMELIWSTFASNINTAMVDLFKDLITGIEGGKEAWKNLWQSFGDTIVDAFRDAFARSLVEKLGFDKMFEGNILDLGNLFKGLGNLVVGVFKGIGNIIGSIFGGIGGAVGGAVGALGGTTVVAGQLAETGVAATTAGNAVAQAGTQAAQTGTQMGIMGKIGLGLQSVVTGVGGALKYFATMGASATTALGALASGLVGVVGFVGTAVAAWTGFAYLAENVIGPALLGVRNFLDSLFGYDSPPWLERVSGSVQEMDEYITKASKHLKEGLLPPEQLKAYENHMLRLTEAIASGLYTIGEMTHEESVKWMAESIAANEQLEKEFKDTLLSVLEASAEGAEAVAARVEEIQAASFERLNTLRDQNNQLIQQGTEATSAAIAKAAIATEQVIKETTGVHKAEFEKQLALLQKMGKARGKEYEKAYEEAKKGAGATLEVYKRLHMEATKLAEEGTEEQIQAFAKQVAAHDTLSQKQKENIYEVLGVTERAYADMANAAGKAANDMSLSTRTAADEMVGATNRATQSMTDSMNRIPTRVDFDVVGRLDMPYIPQVPDQYYNIVGQVTGGGGGYAPAPVGPSVNLAKTKAAWVAYSRPQWSRAGYSEAWIAQRIETEWANNQADIIRRFGQYQAGVSSVPKTGPYWLHRGEEVTSAGEARVEKHGQEGNIYNFKLVNYGDINTVADEEELFRKYTNMIRREVAVR